MSGQDSSDIATSSSSDDEDFTAYKSPGGKEEQFKQSPRSKKVETKGFGSDSKGFGSDSKGFGSDSKGFGSDSKGFGSDSKGFGSDSKGFGSDSKGSASNKTQSSAKKHGYMETTCDLESIGVLIQKAVSYTHLRAHETPEHLVCRLLLEKKKKKKKTTIRIGIFEEEQKQIKVKGKSIEERE
eukprot:TRINITY_DN3552_c0_g1_i2.p1 TRINITY_DN3552_c0_g1~~TRINITY_DN3552_c0_g1_i2.p1  ORF type:complete len:183 (-),score=49.88 TRINITY_DN3552_c0_g1_i2:3-551(-)